MIDAPPTPVVVTLLATLPIDGGQEIAFSEVEGPEGVYLDIRERNTKTGELSEGLMLPPEVWDRIVALVPTL